MPPFERFFRRALEQLWVKEKKTELSPIVRANLAILRVVEASITPEGAVTYTDFERGSKFTISHLNDGAVFRVHYESTSNSQLRFWRYAVNIHKVDGSDKGLYFPKKVIVSDESRLLLPQAWDRSSCDRMRDDLSTTTMLERSDYIYPDLNWDDPLRTFPQDFFINFDTSNRLVTVKILRIQLVDRGHGSQIRASKEALEPDNGVASFQPVTA